MAKRWRRHRFSDNFRHMKHPVAPPKAGSPLRFAPAVQGVLPVSITNYIPEMRDENLSLPWAGPLHDVRWQRGSGDIAFLGKRSDRAGLRCCASEMQVSPRHFFISRLTTPHLMRNCPSSSDPPVRVLMGLCHQEVL